MDSEYGLIDLQMNSHQIVNSVDLWGNGSASDSRSEGCVFKSRQGQSPLTTNVKRRCSKFDYENVHKYRKGLSISDYQIPNVNTGIFVTCTLWTPSACNCSALC